MLRRFRLGRTRRVGAAFIGFSAAVLLVGVAFAVVLVQVTANVTSDEFIPPTTTTSSTTTTTTGPSNGLQVALSPAGSGGTLGSCGSYGTGPLVFSGFSFPLNVGSTAPSNEQHLCIQNNGSSAVSTVGFTAAIAASGEDGCSTAEATVDPDGAGCGTAGELAGVLAFTLTRTDSNGTGASSCIDYSGTIVAVGATKALVDTTPLSVGGACVYRVGLVFAGSPTDDEKLAASTDTAQFAIDVTATP